MKNTKINSRGFALVEVLVAASIITVLVTASAVVAYRSLLVSRQSVKVAQASFLLEEGAEAVKMLRDDSWANISGLTAGATYYPVYSGGAWTLSTTSTKVDEFTRTVVMSGVQRDGTSGDIVSSGGINDPETKLFTVTVSWLDGSQNFSKTLSFYVTNLFEYL